MKQPHWKLQVTVALLALWFFLIKASGSDMTPLAEWIFDRESVLKEWAPNSHISEAAIQDNAFVCKTVGDDPILELQSPLSIPATPRQYIEVKLKSDQGGMAEFFWSNTREGRYGGFSGDKHTQFQIVGGSQWQVYRIFPFWQAESKIIRLRFDLFGASRFAIQYIRIVELPGVPKSETARFDFTQSQTLWLHTDSLEASTNGRCLRIDNPTPDAFILGPPVCIDAAENSFVSLKISTASARKGRVIFAASKTPGMHSLNFSLNPDGQPHHYNLDMLASPNWKDAIVAIGIQLLEGPDATADLQSLEIAAEPKGPPQLAILSFSLDEAAPRIGVPAKLIARISNLGGASAGPIQARLTLPAGLHQQSTNPSEGLPLRLGYSEEASLSWTLDCQEPVSGTARLVLSAVNAEKTSCETELLFESRVPQSKQSYVPEPKPVRGKYDVGVYYFPGWQSRSQWQPVERFPERKPVLGWYREGDPEVADWQIKWAVEHGITYFAYDWYWSQGARHLEHGLHDAYFKARYRNLLKFCLLWANHNAPGTHSIEDSARVARHWIENYFQRPEYYRIDGKPVVIIFSPYNYKSDLSIEGVNKAFEVMRAECRKAGLPGLYLAACVANPRQVDGESYDAITAYNWPSLGLSGTQNQAPYSSLLPEYRRHWEQLLKEDSRSLLLPLSGGWDSRPWHGDTALVRTDRRPEHFLHHLRDARQFLEDNRSNPKLLPSIIIEAWNEWGEGSYVEPHKEFGFGYLDAIRTVFADDAPGHTDLAPVDAGLGPYDLPAVMAHRTGWTFETDGADWKNTMNLDQVKLEAGVLKAISSGNDPAFFSPPIQASTRDFSRVHLRLRLTNADGGSRLKENAQLFWASKRWPESEASSIRFPVAIDGVWHDYNLDAATNPRWKGILTRLRLDPVNQSGILIEIAQIELLPSDAVSKQDSATKTGKE